MNVAPLIFGLLAAFGLIGLAMGALAYRRQPARGWAPPLLIGLAGAYAGGLQLGLAPRDVAAGRDRRPTPALLGALALELAHG